MIFRGFISLFFILILSFVALIDTDIGLILLIKATPGKATASQVSGTLLQGATIKNFNYHYDDLTITFDELNFHWQWQALLKENLVIDKVNLKNMVVHLPKSSNSDSSIHLSSIHLPINLYIKQVLLDNITIYNKKNNYVINKIHLTADVVNDVIMLHQFSVLTPYFSTSSQGKININNWSSINFNNTLTANSRPEISILTNISGDKDILSLNIKSVKWLNINLIIKNYLQRADTITLKSDWFVDTTQADFPELKKLNGKLQLSGHANGRLLQPTIDGKLLVQN